MVPRAFHFPGPGVGGRRWVQKTVQFTPKMPTPRRQFSKWLGLTVQVLVALSPTCSWG